MSSIMTKIKIYLRSRNTRRNRKRYAACLAEVDRQYGELYRRLLKEEEEELQCQSQN